MGEDLTTPTDPTVAMLAYKTSYTGTTTTLTWDGAATVPALSHLARLSAGVYETWLDTTSRLGVWACQGKSTGVNQAASEPVEFEVLASL
jgi:hypothetical protein